MARAIDLDRQLERRAVEVEDVGSDAELAAEAVPEELLLAEAGPEEPFGRGHRGAEGAALPLHLAAVVVLRHGLTPPEWVRPRWFSSCRRGVGPEGSLGRPVGGRAPALRPPLATTGGRSRWRRWLFAKPHLS